MAIQDEFKQALSTWASGVAVVTTADQGLLYGLTVSSFTSVSLDPPLVLVCLATSNRMPAMITSAQRFAVSILGRDQEEASSYFAISGREPTAEFVEVEGDWTPGGMPVVQGAIAWLECELYETLTHGDHSIVVGEVVAARATEAPSPLIYYRRAYRGVTD
ncbi:MAG: flavin reductase family protein [Deltaproteobacteria bacterium]|nr:flavin reductase family protein [Deltaproteobacteria bacterium]MCB9785096.1 flavin reductase family protein [Deltaproteobacteria bacterium]